MDTKLDLLELDQPSVVLHYKQRSGLAQALQVALLAKVLPCLPTVDNGVQISIIAGLEACFLGQSKYMLSFISRLVSCFVNPYTLVVLIPYALQMLRVRLAGSLRM